MDLQAIFGAEPIQAIEPVVAMPAEPDTTPGWTEYFVRRSGQVWRVIQKDDANVADWDTGLEWK